MRIKTKNNNIEILGIIRIRIIARKRIRLMIKNTKNDNNNHKNNKNDFL